jgi:hypothetical protein
MILLSQKKGCLCDKKVYCKPMQSIDSKVVNRIYGKQRGWAFSKIDFADLGSDAAIRKALSRLEARGTIRRVIRGVYDYPQFSSLLKEPMGTNLNELANALARRSGWRIQASENTALNLLGLSTQVPAQSVYLSDGPTKTYKIGNRNLIFKSRGLKESGFKLRESELLVQALKALGQERIDDKVKQKLSQLWPLQLWRKILRDTRTAPAWVHAHIRSIADSLEP